MNRTPIDDDHEDAGLGPRLRDLREKAIGPTGKRMTQADLAAAANVSLDLVRKLEQGVRHSASLPSIHKLARALDVEITKLLDKEAALPQPTENSGVVALRRAVTGIDDLLDDFPGDAVSLPDLRRTVTYTWGSYWSGRYDQLGETLPDALRGARTLEPAGEAADLAAQLYQAAGCTLVHLGQPDAAHMAVREAIRLARSGHDPLRLSALQGTMSWLLLTQGRFEEAYRLAEKAAAEIEPAAEAELPRMAMCGSLLLGSATAAGRNGDPGNAHHLLGEAKDIARHTGHRNDYECAFGPDQVTMQTVDVHVVTDAYASALTAAKAMPRDTPLSVNARARHLQDRAHAHVRLGHDQSAENTLWAMADLVPPVWLQQNVQAKMLVRELRGRERRARKASRLGDLARRFGLAS